MLLLWMKLGYMFTTHNQNNKQWNGDTLVSKTYEISCSKSVRKVLPSDFWDCEEVNVKNTTGAFYLQ